MQARHDVGVCTKNALHSRKISPSATYFIKKPPACSWIADCGIARRVLCAHALEARCSQLRDAANWQLNPSKCATEPSGLCVCTWRAARSIRNHDVHTFDEPDLCESDP
eukprot:1136509-Pelagomonas_calceolata.AAC.5